MGSDTILLIERSSSKENVFANALERKGYTAEVVATGRAALGMMDKHAPVLVILNAASLGTNGLRICQQLSAHAVEVPIIHIFPEDSDKALTDSSPANITLVMPFTPRKLINRVRGFMPGVLADAIEVGAIKLSPTARIVQANGKESKLTPKAATLLELFMKHPGKTLDRGYLMREVWDTDYIGDTRTLDVHVRWLREAIEADPRKPKLIKTMRGKGYQFILEPQPTKSKSE